MSRFVFSESQQAHVEPDSIFIPQEARGQSITGFPLSVRLANVLRGKGIQLLGDLHGLTVSAFAACRNCGQKTLQELDELVRTLQGGHQSSHATSVHTPPRRDRQARCFFVPIDGHELNPFDLPMSPRLEKVLRTKGITRLRDLHEASLDELLRVRTCGTKAVEELARLLDRVADGEFQPSKSPFSSSETGELLRSLDAIVAKLSARNREIFLLRLGATDKRASTLDEVGSKFQLTRERVRQIVEKLLPAIRKEGGPRLLTQLSGVAARCRELVCPLTPALVSQWLGQHATGLRFSLSLYVRLLGELNPEIPAWPKGQEPLTGQRPSAKAILNALETVLYDASPAVSVKKAFELTRASASRGAPTVGKFLEAVKHAKNLVVEFPQPDQPQVRLRYLRTSTVVKSVLAASDRPLTPEEIISRAQAKFGSKLIERDPRSLGNSLTPGNGFYLLGPRAYGLREHFTLPQNMCRSARADVRDLLSKENRPISTTEIVNERKFPWTADLNAYELAQILREDKQFIDLGRFLFALAAWGIEEREYVRDLIPKILAEVGRPMTASAILEQLQRLRSTSPSSIAATLRKHSVVRDFGFGHYGLRSWDDSVKNSIVGDPALVERVIRRSEPPLSFSRLCSILEVPDGGRLADKLWQTCASLRSVIRSPADRTPTALLLHKSCSLERALAATARAVGRPLPLYEFQWDLNARFGPLFTQRSSAEIGRCLEQSQLFLRNADGEFILDINLDQLGLDEEAIRRASLEILSDSNEIVGCDDLVERLEAEGKVWEELSPDILGSLLREDGAFQEVGHNRFRAKPCKR